MPEVKERLPITIRQACQEDTPQVLELTGKIWGGEDYVPYVWEEWLHAASGHLVVAEYQGKLVGLARLNPATQDDWWMQGLRVHPDFDGQGIGGQLHEYIVRYWEENCQGTLRLGTNDNRYPIHRLCARTGFNRIGEYSFFEAESLAELTSAFRSLAPSEAPSALQAALKNPIWNLTNGMMDIGWLWLPPAMAPIQQAIAKGRAFWWRDTQGLLLLGEDTEDDPKKAWLVIQLAACPLEALADLLVDLRRLAASLGIGLAGWSAPLYPEILAALEAAGYQRAWERSLYLYEKKAASPVLTGS